MAHGSGPSASSERRSTAEDFSVTAAERMLELGTLLEELEQVSATTSSSPPSAGPQSENQLTQVRLGIASSLYAALRFKHAATAGHALRVALTSSAWALKMDLPNRQRDVIELAALLHDVGIIGVPDRILVKPAPLDPNESQIVEQSRRMGVEILRSACAEPMILNVVENVWAWYDGSKGGYRVQREQIPLAARMIAIVEAFDAMTTDQVYRSAMSLERATIELFEFAGTQFDPELVKQFAEFYAGNQARVRQEVAGRWLRTLDPEFVNSYWELTSLPSPTSQTDNEALFESRLLDNMHDAVVFIDPELRVVQWNHGAERLTGIAQSSVLQRQWAPDLLKMRSEKGEQVGEEDCPVVCAVRSSVQSLRRLTIWGRAGEPVAVDSHTIPVVDTDGTTLGAVLLLHDASPETSLEQRCQNLHEKATKDPLTQVANRAEFDRVLDTFVNTHKQQQVPCSLIICDLDRFKQVNDTYGHQAGDVVIKSLARLLKNSCRPGDLVARYGGEEFVMLCADCDNNIAARRAEKIRKRLSQISQPELNGRTATASFGVTEIQPGDTAETMLRRSDRGLLMAKAKGRNTVVQLGSGSSKDLADGKSGWSLWGKGTSGFDSVLTEELFTPVPITIAIEKLRGFVADRQAGIISIEGNSVELEIDDRAGPVRRRSDRPVRFRVQLRFEEEQCECSQASDAPLRTISRTKIHVTINPRKKRARRRADVNDRAGEVLASICSYLMASRKNPYSSQNVLRRIKSVLTPWLSKP